MKVRDYDTMYNENTGNTATHIATDTAMLSRDNDQNAYEEGFGAESGVRNETAESGGRIHAPEAKDGSRPHSSVSSIDKENAGLADN